MLYRVTEDNGNSFVTEELFFLGYLPINGKQANRGYLGDYNSEKRCFNWYPHTAVTVLETESED